LDNAIGALGLRHQPMKTAAEAGDLKTETPEAGTGAKFSAAEEICNFEVKM